MIAFSHNGMFLKQKKIILYLRYHTSIYITTLIGLAVPLKTLISVVCDTQMELYFQKKIFHLWLSLVMKLNHKNFHKANLLSENHASL